MSQRGMSLLELMVCCAILSILAAIVLPRFSVVERSQLDYEAACLVAELRYLQVCSHTVQRMHPDFLDVPEAENEPSLFMESDQYYIRQGMDIQRRHFLPPSVKLRADRVQFVFGMDGNPAYHIPLTIHLLQAGEERRVIIDSVGRVRVEK